MKLHLRDKNPAVVAAWREVFADVAHDVTISEGDILELEGDAIVSPANSFGWMDGGIDLAYRARFGVEVERELQREIHSNRWHGEIPVGGATIIDTHDQRIPLLIAAPTMRVPEPVTGVNAYLAMRAALLAFQLRAWSPIDQPGTRKAGDDVLLCPGLCTLTGRMPPRQAAGQMRHAWYVAAELHDSISDPRALIAFHHAMVLPR